MAAEDARRQSASETKPATSINIDTSALDDSTCKASLNMDTSHEDCARVGLSKDELMKYANQPFWVRLRNVLFASFWIMWLSILFVAISYVVNSPSCAPKLVSAATVAANATTAAASTTPAA